MYWTRFGVQLISNELLRFRPYCLASDMKGFPRLGRRRHKELISAHFLQGRAMMRRRQKQRPIILLPVVLAVVGIIIHIITHCYCCYSPNDTHTYTHTIIAIIMMILIIIVINAFITLLPSSPFPSSPKQK